MKKTLITGASGGLGSAVTGFLKSKTDAGQISVMLRDDNSQKAEQYKREGFDVRTGDYNHPETLDSAFGGIEVLYFVSGNDVVNRLPQHQNVIAAAKKAGVQHIIYTSSVRKTEGEQTPLHLIINAHSQTEDLIRNSGIPYTLLRHNLYGEVVPMFLGERSQLLNSKAVYLPTGKGKTAFVPRRDFAEAAALILTNPEPHKNKIYEFNGSESLSFEEISAILSEVTGNPIACVSPEVNEFEQTMHSAGVPAEITGIMTMFSLGIKDGEFDQSSKDLENILGRKTTPLKAFLAEAYAVKD